VAGRRDTHAHAHAQTLTPIALLPQDQCEEYVARVLGEVTIPEYKPSEKVGSLNLLTISF
jgi:hypothetical protein